ncbi:MAG: murein tripeptide amidase MpaA [Vibrio sp.]
MPNPQRARENRGQFQSKPQVYGYSVLGAPLLYFPAANKNQHTGLVIAGTHGDEAASIVTLSCALRSIEASSLKHDVILCMNPDGSQLGTRANANGVDLNRNFATQNWQSGGTVYRWNSQAKERDVNIGTGDAPNSEPETQALCDLILKRQPAWICSFHEPLACIDDPKQSQLGQWLSQAFQYPLVKDVGYQTPGSFGTWCEEHNYLCVTAEFAPISADKATEQHLNAMIALLTTDISAS